MLLKSKIRKSGQTAECMEKESPRPHIPLLIPVGKKQDIHKLLWVHKYNPSFHQIPLDIIKVISSYLYSRRNLVEGDALDVLKSNGKWCLAAIKEVNGSEIFVHYFSSGKLDNEWIERSSPLLDLPFTFSPKMVIYSSKCHRCVLCNKVSEIGREYPGVLIWG
jgi:hypothetical protein